MAAQPEAMRAHQRALEIRERLAHDHPSVPPYQRDLADSHYNIGILLIAMARQSDAMASYRRALKIREQLAHDYPKVPQYQRDLARSHYNIGILLNEMNEPTEAMASYTRRWRSASGWPATIPLPPSSSATWPEATTTSASCSPR